MRRHLPSFSLLRLWIELGEGDMNFSLLTPPPPPNPNVLMYGVLSTLGGKRRLLGVQM